MSSSDGFYYRWAMLIGHYYEYIIGSLFIVAAILSFVIPPGSTHNASLLVPFVLVPAAIIVCFALPLITKIVHDSHLCSRCAASFPLDGAEQADRHLRALRYYHSNWAPVLQLGIVALVIVAGFWHKWTLDLVLVLILAAAGIFNVRNAAIHHRLQLWCPYCRRNGGRGPHESSPEPTPDPAGSRPVS